MRHIAMKTLLVTVASLLISQLAAAEEITGFKNYKFGDSLSQYLKDNSFSCAIDKLSKFGDYKCTKNKPETETIAGKKLNWLELQFAWDTNKLRYIYAIYLDSNDYPDVLDYSTFVPRETSQIKQLLTDKHGEPEDYCGKKGCSDLIWRRGASMGDPYIHLNVSEIRFAIKRDSEAGKLSDTDQKRQDEYIGTMKR